MKCIEEEIRINTNPGGYILRTLPGGFQDTSPSLLEERECRN